MLRSALEGAPTPATAIMTNSTMVRGIITSLNWFADNQLAAFDQRDLAGALRYLADHDAALDSAKALATLTAFAKELSVELPGGWSRSHAVGPLRR